MPETTVVIVTYNSRDDVEACITTVRPARDISIVVIDNDSTDGTPAVLQSLAAQGAIDHLVLSSSNDGFAKAANQGLKLAGDSDVFLLNPDATIDAESFERLRSIAAADPTIGIVAPLVDNGPQVQTIGAGRQPTLWPLFTHFSGLARLFPSVRMFRGRHLYRGPHGSTEHDVEWVSGCAMYISRRALERVGPLSENWFMYGEDVEFAQRVRRAGFTVRLTPEAQAWHALGASVNSAPGPVSVMWAENTYAYYVAEFRPGPIRRLAWRMIFSAGLGSRALLLSARALLTSRAEERVSLLARSRRFLSFAGAVWRVQPKAA